MSKAEKEAALNAKIAAIRAKNEALKRRHEEVQADKKEAEKIETSVTCEPPASTRIRSPISGGSHQSGSRLADVKKQSVKGRSNGSLIPNGSPSKASSSTRLKDSPPPDPAYRFLADRMRDGTPSESSAGEGEEGAKAGTRTHPTISLDRLKPEKRRELLAKGAQDENRSPSRRKGHSRRPLNGFHEDYTEERNGLILQEIPADSLSPSKFSPKKHQQQSRGSPQKIPEEGGLQISEQPAEWIPSPGDDQIQWSSDPNQLYYGQPSEWETMVVPGASWAEELDNEQSPQVVLNGTQLAYVNPVQFPSGHISEQYGGGMAIYHPPMSGHEYIPSPSHYPHYNNPSLRGENVSTMNNSSSNYRAAAPNRAHQHNSNNGSSSHNNNNAYNNFKNHHRSSRSENWRSREVTKIPPRFQKQKPSSSYPSKPRHNPVSSLQIPKATSEKAPPGCSRLILFGSPSIINRLRERGTSSFIHSGLSSQREFPLDNLEDFKKHLPKIEPQLDSFLLIHALDNEARDIARKNSRNDVEKGLDSDETANEFSDIIEALLEKIPYLRIFISTLLPRFDFPESTGLSFPNNVRKVMNVQISTRLRSHPKITLLNNDPALDHLTDEARMLSLYEADGHSLSLKGLDALLKAWSENMEEFLPLSKEGGEDIIKDDDDDINIAQDLQKLDVNGSDSPPSSKE